MTEFNLNKEEIEILKLLVNGPQNLEIAKLMAIDIENVELHIENILRKLQAKSKTEAVVKAIKYLII